MSPRLLPTTRRFPPAHSQTLHIFLNHTIAMRKGAQRAIVAGSLVLACLSASPVYADPTPTPSPSAESGQNPMIQYKINRDIYATAMKTRAANIKAINKTFSDAIKKADADYFAALSQSKSPALKFQLGSARMSAKSAAIAARDAAILALGPEPIEPTEPPVAFSATAKSGQKQSKGKKN